MERRYVWRGGICGEEVYVEHRVERRYMWSIGWRRGMCGA